MESENENNNELNEDLNTLQQLMIENTLLIKKQLSNSILPLFSIVGVISIIILGLLINVGVLFINILVAVILIAVISLLIIIRYFFCSYPTNSVVEYIVEGTPLKERKTLPYIDKFITFVSAQEIYDTVKENLADEWGDLYSLFESRIEDFHNMQEDNNS